MTLIMTNIYDVILNLQCQNFDNTIFVNYNSFAGKS